MSKLRVAVVGAGRLGGFHAQKLSRIDSVELVAVADPVESQRCKVAEECGTQAAADYRELLGRVDAAVIATPTRSHHAVAMEFLRRKTHLLVEKPLCTTAAEAEELVDEARRAGVVLQVGHVERFNPAWNAALERIGEPKFIDAERTSGYTFRSTDIGAVLDIMIHDLDLVLSLVRSRVVNVEAIGVSVLGGHEDVANVRLEFRNGCVAVLNASRVSYESRRRMQLWSLGGFASIDFASRKATIVRPSESLVRREIDFLRLTPDQWQCKEQLLAEHLHREELELAAVDALALEDQDFVDAVRNVRPPRVTGEDGRDAVATAERILEAIRRRYDDGRLGAPAELAPSILPVAPLRRAVERETLPRREAG